jgi:hypothetical protein
MCVLDLETERTCRLTCARCRTSADYVYNLVDGREPDTWELRTQLRERYGLMFNAYTFPPLAKEYCRECGSRVAQELLEASVSPDPAESLPTPLSEQEGMFG